MSIGNAMAQLQGLLDKSRELHPELAAKWDAEDKRDAELTEMLRTNCIDAIELIAQAMRHPRISHSNLTDAIDMLTVALDCAKALDH